MSASHFAVVLETASVTTVKSISEGFSWNFKKIVLFRGGWESPLNAKK
jgi:hypothetical protein